MHIHHVHVYTYKHVHVPVALMRAAVERTGNGFGQEHLIPPKYP